MHSGNPYEPVNMIECAVDRVQRSVNGGLSKHVLSEEWKSCHVKKFRCMLQFMTARVSGGLEHTHTQELRSTNCTELFTSNNNSKFQRFENL